MSIEQQQVNVQELQRLNETIALCVDTLRRVAPQLGQVQAVLSQLTSQVAPQIGTIGTNGSQLPWGLGISPWYMYGHSPLYGHAQPFGAPMMPQFTQPQYTQPFLNLNQRLF